MWRIFRARDWSSNRSLALSLLRLGFLERLDETTGHIPKIDIRKGRSFLGRERSRTMAEEVKPARYQPSPTRFRNNEINTVGMNSRMRGTRENHPIFILLCLYSTGTKGGGLYRRGCPTNKRNARSLFLEKSNIIFAESTANTKILISNSRRGSRVRPSVLKPKLIALVI